MTFPGGGGGGGGGRYFSMRAIAGRKPGASKRTLAAPARVEAVEVKRKRTRSRPSIVVGGVAGRFCWRTSGVNPDSETTARIGLLLANAATAGFDGSLSD